MTAEEQQPQGVVVLLGRTGGRLGRDDPLALAPRGVRALGIDELAPGDGGQPGGPAPRVARSEANVPSPRAGPPARRFSRAELGATADEGAEDLDTILVVN